MKLQTLAASSLFLIALAGCAAGESQSSATAAPVGSAPAASDAAATEDASATDATAFTERDFKFDTPNVTVSGERFALAVTNEGPTIHSLRVRDESAKDLGGTQDLKPGASETVTLQLPAGSYTIFCSLPGHESLGMRGTLTVEP